MIIGFGSNNMKNDVKARDQRNIYKIKTDRKISSEVQ